jgi:predicted RNA binding protein YcfA (HicA-like mRNA interferase family)
MGSIPVADVVQILDRDGVLDLNNNEHTYSEQETPIEVDWDRLFPSLNARHIRRPQDDEEDWAVGEDREERGQDYVKDWAFDIPADWLDDILGALGSGTDGAFPSDVANGTIWDTCAWYQPIHYFGLDFGIFVREDCIRTLAKDIASRIFVHRSSVTHSHHLAKAVIRAAFASFFLHEHFHHKVESLGFRLHVVLGRSAYRSYKDNVYRPTVNPLSDDCLEEALANADSYKRLDKSPYNIVGRTVLNATKQYLKYRFTHLDPPGYRKAIDRLSPSDFDDGLRLLQGQVLEATLKPSVRPRSDWRVATNLTKSLYTIKKEDLYIVVPRGSAPVLPAKISPLCSSRDMLGVFRTMGWSEVKGGKGSHIKLKNNGQTFILPGNRKDLSPGVIGCALKVLGNYTMSDLPKLIQRS